MTGSNAYNSRRIAREFDGQIHHGTVDGFDAAYNLWHISYDDGDAEEMNHTELLFAMDLFEGNSDRSYVGRRVSREFGRKVCDGTVDKFDSRRSLWKIAYDYGEVGEMDHRELLYAVDLFNGKSEAKSSSGKGKRKAPISHRTKRNKNQSGDDVQLFAFKCDDPVVKEERSSERPKRKLKVVNRFDPLSYNSQTHCPAGHGFACPRCSSICSYDCRECEECYLSCCYAPGVGPVVLKERTRSPRRKTKAARSETAKASVALKSSSLNGVPQVAKDSRKSIEDVTDILLAVKQEQQKKKAKDAVELD